ncbi:MAG: hypothetical protein NW237_09695 [Cyanobacteriota bacterium]|nr:hypothetical protein [Cyanobacteriota bacterium]
MQPYSSPFPPPGSGQPPAKPVPSTGNQAEADTQERVPVGQQLLRAGLLTPAQLAQALREQQQTHLKFGEVCLEHRWISPEQLYQITSSDSLCLGEILVARGYIDIEQLRIALARQRRFGRKLGEILVWKGWIQPEVIDQVLQEQKLLRESQANNAWQALQSAPPLLPSAENSEPSSSLVYNPTSLPPIPLSSLAPIEGSRSSLSVPMAVPIPPPPTSPAIPIPAGILPVVPIPSAPLPPVPAPEGIDTTGTQLAIYRNRLATLEIQLEMQQREWDAMAAQMNEQVAQFQTQYQHRITLLETKLKQQETEQLAAQQALSQTYQQRIEGLESELAQQRTSLEMERSQQSERQAAQLAISEQYQQRIRDLEGELASQQSLLEKRSADQSEFQILSTQYQKRIEELQDELNRQIFAEQEQQHALATQQQQIDELENQLKQQLLQHQQQQQEISQRYQQRIQLLEDKLEEQQQQKQQAQSTHQEVDHLRSEIHRLSGELQRVQPIEAKYQTLSQQVQPLLQKLSQTKAHVVQLGQALQKSQASQQQYQRLLQTQKAQLEKAQSTAVKLAKELRQTRQEMATLREQVQTQNPPADLSPQPPQPEMAALQTQLQGSHSLMVAYRQSLENLQNEIKAQRDENRLLQAKLDRQTQITEVMEGQLRKAGDASSGWTSVTNAVQSQLDQNLSKQWETITESIHIDPTLQSGQTPVLTAWARQLFFRLQEADLISDEQIQAVLRVWSSQGGKLTHVLSEQTGLQPSTIKFFSDEGYSAKLFGCRRIGEYLQAAGLVTEADLQAALQDNRQGRRLGEALADRGLIRPSTADYFARTFTSG